MHTIGPGWSATEDHSRLPADCYRNSMHVAAGLARAVLFDRGTYDSSEAASR